AELIKEMRDAKEKAIEVRMQQLQDLVDRSKDSDDENAASDNTSLGMNLARKILNNITVVLEDVHVAFMNSQRGLACCMDLPNLAVLSTDKTFRERDDSEGAVVPGESMYKTLQMKDFSVRMSPAGTRDLQEAAYVLSPVSANLQLSHEPANNLLKIKLMVATEELAEVFLRRSQVKHLRSIKSDLNEEARKFHLMLVPEADQKEINQDAGDSTDEYSQLYERSIAEAWQIMAPDLRPLSPEDERRKQLLEDALSARLLARARWKVERKAEVLNEEVVRRKREKEESRVAEQRKKTGLLGRFWGRQESEDEVEAPETALLSSEEKDQLFTDLKDVSKVEQVDVPKRFSFEFVLGQMALDLIDDQHQDEVRRQLMSLALREAGIKLDINMATDFRGRDSAEWGMKIDLKSFHALHQTRAFMQLKSVGLDGKDHSQWLSDGSSAASFDIQSKLQKEQNLLDISFKLLALQ
ncbi:Vps13c, partial [Symbiodinium sp. CCMP2456]